MHRDQGAIDAALAAIRGEMASLPVPVPDAAATEVPSQAAVPLTPVTVATSDMDTSRPDPAALSGQIDTEARALLAPMLRAWLDAHLPEIVEAAVDAELRRLTGLA